MLPILLIQGLNQLSELYFEELIKSEVLAASTSDVHRVLFPSENDMESVSREIRLIRELKSGLYKAVIVFDLNWEQNCFLELLGPALCRFVKFRAGHVAFPTTGDIAVLPALVELFNVPWVSAECYRNTWGTWQSSAATVDRKFPITRFVPNSVPSSQFRLSGTAFTLLNVPATDRCFGVTKDSEYDSLFISPNDSDGDGPMEDNSTDGETSDAISSLQKGITQGPRSRCCFRGIADKSNTPSHPTRAAGHYSQTQTTVVLFAFDDTCTARERSSQAEHHDVSENSHVIIALRQFGAGSICYFGNANCEPATADMLFSFCLA